MGHPIRNLCVLGASSLMAVACTAHAPQVVDDRTPTQSTYVSVSLDDPLREACRDFEMPDPRFEFDSAKVDDDTRAMLLGFATCLEGPMKSVVVRLMGQADPRGSEDYNLELGLDRAQAIKDVLVEHGVAPDRVLVTSIGEGAASVQRPWYDDRKVSIETAGGAASAGADGTTYITIYGEDPQGGLLVFEERGDVDGDGVDEPALYFQSEGGEFTPLPAFSESGDVDGDGVDEPRERG